MPYSTAESTISDGDGAFPQFLEHLLRNDPPRGTCERHDPQRRRRVLENDLALERADDLHVVESPPAICIADFLSICVGLYETPKRQFPSAEVRSPQPLVNFWFGRNFEGDLGWAKLLDFGCGIELPLACPWFETNKALLNSVDNVGIDWIGAVGRGPDCEDLDRCETSPCCEQRTPGRCRSGRRLAWQNNAVPLSIA